MPRPERRTRGDLVAAALIAVTVIAAATVLWVTGDAAGTASRTAASPIAVPTPSATVPRSLDTAWTVKGTTGSTPVVVGGTVVTAIGNRVDGIDPTTGSVAWSYDRSAPLCSVISGWDSAVAVYRDGRGCGQVTALDGATGRRGAQRTSDADDPVALSYDGTYVLSRGESRLEVWRSDLVRTLEYGRVDAPVNPGDQPRSGCSFFSGASSSSRIAVLEQCGGEQGPRLTVMNPAPRDATQPDVYGSTILTDVPAGESAARVLSVSGERVLLYLPATGTVPARIGVFDGSGAFVSAQDLPAGAAPTENPLSQPVITTGAVLLWFTGTATVAIDRVTSAVRWILPNTLGVGMPMAGDLLVPTAGALAVIDPGSGTVRSSIPVDRGSFTGPVGAAVLGSMVLEQRGSDLVALRPRAG